MHSRRNRVVLFLLVGVVLLLIVAVAATMLYLLLRPQPTVTVGWRDPVAAATPDRVIPALALYPLAGALELDAIDRAIDVGELETAYALLVFGLDPSDAQRIGRLILMGERFAAAGQPDRAALCYQQVYDLAILSPDLSDAARADALLAVGKGWTALGQPAQALNAWDQVYILAIHSPYLQKAVRRDLLSALTVAYRDLGQADRSQLCRQQIDDLDREASRPAGSPDQWPELLAEGEPVSSAEVGAAEENRRQAAYALREATEGGRQPPPDLVDNLAQALLAEDGVKLAFYAQELEGTSQPGRRLNVHRQMIRWLTLKYQVASRGLGLSVVPAWEADEAGIRSALSKAYEDLLFDYEDLVTALPQVSLIGPARYQVRCRIALAGRLGQYPNFGVQQMADKVRDAATALIATATVDRPYVDVAAEEGGLRFVLSPADQYGLPAQSP